MKVMNPRKLTPSMSLLLVFEASARHESYTRAADELALSQSAVSRQVQALEEQLGAALFRRQGRSVKLTEVGRRYHSELRPALDRIRQATLQAMSSQSGFGALRLATLPTFGSKWLLPRLHAFYALHPGANVHIHSRIGAVDFSAGDIDAAITVGEDAWPGLVAHRLAKESLIAVCAPGVRPHSQMPSPQWLYAQTFLTIVSYPQAWSDWLAHHAIDPLPMRHGPSFELTSHLIQAVAAGLGVGVLPHSLVKDELMRGTLVAFGETVPSRRSYYFIYPPRNEDLPALAPLREWLLSSLTNDSA